MQAKPSPLKCLGYFLTELALNANPQHDVAKPIKLDFKDLHVESSVETVPANQGKPLWRVVLRIQQNVGPDKNSPYNFAAVLLGHFQVHPKYPADQAQQLVEINGSSILYSAVRQILRDAMNNGPFHPLVLPTVSFAEQAPAPQANKVAEAQADYGEKHR